MPILPYIINGTIKNSNSINIANARVTFTTASGSVSGVTNSEGKYILDLANAEYTVGETVTYIAWDSQLNQTYSATFVVAGGGIEINITLALRTDSVNPPGNTDIQIHNIGGKIVTEDNPFPIIDVNLPDNYKSVWVITRGDGQPDTHTITLRGVSYKRTFTYSSNILTERSEWVRQS